jgi:hypothetical protein
MLKTLMHSMSMSMIREKAVLNFLKRIQLVSLAPVVGGGEGEEGLVMQVPGWLELRKGFYTFLTVSGDLIIFRDGVIAPEIDQRDEEERETRDEEAALQYPIGFCGQIGVWKIISVELPHSPVEGEGAECKAQPTHSTSPQQEREEEESEDDADEVIDFQSVLNGQFCYLMEVPKVAVGLRVLRSQARPVGCPALATLDSKLRLGVPFLVPDLPGEKKKKMMNQERRTGTFEGKRFLVKYLYSPLPSSTLVHE